MLLRMRISAQMAIMIFNDLIALAKINSTDDLSSIRLIPEQKSLTNRKKLPEL